MVRRPVITNGKAKQLTGEMSVTSAWAILHQLPAKKLDEYPGLVALLPDEEPFSNLVHMINSLNGAKQSMYRLFGLDQETIEELVEAAEEE